MESASWQRPLYGFEISQNQAKMPLKSGFSDGLGGAKFVLSSVYYIVQPFVSYPLVSESVCKDNTFGVNFKI